MKPALRLLVALIILFSCSSWGFFAHYRIHHLAVFTLPKAMATFYKSNIDYITEHAVTADKRRYTDSTEAPRHFLDADYYGKTPFKTIPHKWNDAVDCYSKDTIIKYGTVPWSIQYEYYRLVRAFKAHDTTDILHTSADLGHYVSDACVPLHTTMNYDGQLTNQKGLHALWESRLPEQFADKYHLYIGKARYIENPLSEAFILCRSSFKGVDSVVRFEQILNKTFPADKKYSKQQRGTRKVTDYSPEYCAAYHKLMHGMVERRMRTAILAVGSYWYSAWVDAGQPDLNKLIAVKMSEEEKVKLDKEEVAFKAVVGSKRKKK
ncbi:zinc dependent phospholipase C family protein [Mucilaginibacter jinjuensis]|uniref:Zinc dependent phospholipase C family protein n=1 Tax=Mucilaginibacter jinjuensis TaxID=1176721 RepID=A0ABY7TBA3_9SPHI|nr:zinc dependent phospholipase C family protein [Mucilaginibacter jinjuensis]WCT13593.1 zinc dependent phospholipase C family protein [Mucilaginibacter jinjuensis]